MENMDIQIIKSRRRTVSIEVHTDGSVILRAPNRMTKKELDIFIDKHMSWIESKQQLMKERKEEKIPTNAKAFDMLTPKERAVIRGTFIRKVEYYSKIMNVTVGRVTRHAGEAVVPREMLILITICIICLKNCWIM